MSGYRYAAAVSAGLILAFPFFASAQDTDPIPGLELPSFEVSIEIEISDVDVHLPDWSDLNDNDPGLAIEGIIGDEPERMNKGDLINKLAEAAEVAEAARKKGSKPSDKDAVASFSAGNPLFELDVTATVRAGDPIPDVDVTLRNCPCPPPPDDS